MENRWPDTFVEIHPDDAAANGIENGDEVRMYSDDILIQTRGWNRVKGDEINFTWLMENGHIRVAEGEARAVAIVTDAGFAGRALYQLPLAKQPGQQPSPPCAGSDHEPLSV